MDWAYQVLSATRFSAPSRRTKAAPKTARSTSRWVGATQTQDHGWCPQLTQSVKVEIVWLDDSSLTFAKLLNVNQISNSGMYMDV